MVDLAFSLRAMAERLDSEAGQSDRPGQLERLEREAATLRRAAFEADRLSAEPEKLRKAILDIDAHATPIGLLHNDDPDGSPHHYLLTVGALHRALGVVGHTAPPCQPCQAAYAEPTEAAIERAIAAAWGVLEERRTVSYYESEDSEADVEAAVRAALSAIPAAGRGSAGSGEHRE